MLRWKVSSELCQSRLLLLHFCYLVFNLNDSCFKSVNDRMLLFIDSWNFSSIYNFLEHKDSFLNKFKMTLSLKDSFVIIKILTLINLKNLNFPFDIRNVLPNPFQFPLNQLNIHYRLLLFCKRRVNFLELSLNIKYKFLISFFSWRIRHII